MCLAHLPRATRRLVLSFFALVITLAVLCVYGFWIFVLEPREQINQVMDASPFVVLHPVGSVQEAKENNTYYIRPNQRVFIVRYVCRFKRLSAIFSRTIIDTLTGAIYTTPNIEATVSPGCYIQNIPLNIPALDKGNYIIRTSIEWKINSFVYKNTTYPVVWFGIK